MSRSNLYEQDYFLWLEETIDQLKNQDFAVVDWSNLIEEITYLSRKEKSKLKSLLTRLIEHLLKLGYWESERDYNAAKWKAEIRTFRKQIAALLEDSPSLKPFLSQIWENCYSDAREIMADLTDLPLTTFPVEPSFTVGQALDENWLPIEDSN